MSRQIYAQGEIGRRGDKKVIRNRFFSEMSEGRKMLVAKMIEALQQTPLSFCFVYQKREKNLRF